MFDLSCPQSQAEELRTNALDEMSKLTARHQMNIETLNGTILALQAENNGLQADARRLKAENERLLGDVAGMLMFCNVYL